MADRPDVAPEARAAALDSHGKLVNDFSLQVATVNGSGSQSSNMVLMRSIFQMGVPVSGKNLFPSNIAGLPTWFTIRANKDGWIARKKEIDFLVAMNPETAREDVLSLASGRAVVYEESLKLSDLRSDLTFYPVPFSKLSGEVSPDSKLRKLLANMITVGVVGYLLDIDREEIDGAVRRQFRSKPKAAELNLKAVEVGVRYAIESLVKRDPCQVQRMDKTAGKIIIEGNAAAALGAIFHGCTVVPWYPITPSTSLVETMMDYAKKYRLDPETGKATFAIVQAEDELAALGMVLGAGWAGARAMTATSGPGISLMSEFAGLAYFAEVPAVVWDVQRIGPSTGLPTRTSQGDILSAYYLSHGDSRHVVLFPASVEECFTMAGTALDLSERLQTPVFVLSDLDLGMNNWMSDRFTYPEQPIDRGKVLSADELERLGKFERYRDVDGDGIAYRTLPGTKHPLAAYFTRGSGHNEKAQYSERPEDFKNLMDRLARKHETAKSLVPAPVISGSAEARMGIIAYGTSDWAVQESRSQLEHEAGVRSRYLRIKALPFNHQLREFVSSLDRVYVVEQNRDAQMADLIRLETGAASVKIRTVLHYDGIPIDARSITEAILSQEEELSMTTANETPKPKNINRLGLNLNDYKGGDSTLCSGCGHDAISSQIIRAFYEYGVEPQRVAKLSGIGCSSKTPAYFLGRSHGFNGVHGRMPALATGAMLANSDLIAVGVTGDGDSASIGLGQFCHLLRRNVPMIYIVENNGVYGLTKGQFSATADQGSKLKTGIVNDLPAIDLCALAIEMGCAFVARSFAGDPKQLVALIKAALGHRGTAMLDVISPCVTFNNHESSTKSYKHAKETEELLHEIGFVPFFEQITVDYPEGTTREIELHDGSHIQLRKLDRDYDPTNRVQALVLLKEAQQKAEFLTGLVYINPQQQDFLSMLNLVDQPLAALPLERTRPSQAAFDEIMAGLE